MGTGARYLLSGWSVQRFGGAFPYGTLAVNAIGSFALGVLMQTALTTQLLPPTLRLTLTTGVLGGFTTYSTFNYETLQFFQEGTVLMGLVNILATVLLCLAAGALGVVGARWAIGG